MEINKKELKESKTLGELDCLILDILSEGMNEDLSDKYINDITVDNNLNKAINNKYHDYKIYNENKILRLYFDILETDGLFDDDICAEYINVKYKSIEVLDI